jgi:hypothetical protein
VCFLQLLWFVVGMPCVICFCSTELCFAHACVFTWHCFRLIVRSSWPR